MPTKPSLSAAATIDANSLVEGAEFQRSIMTGAFSRRITSISRSTARIWDAFDGNFAAAQTATGLTLDLPNDAYSPTHDYTDRTAGAVVYAAQIPLATISGWVYHDRTTTATSTTPSEAGHRRRDARTARRTASPTGITTTTSNDPATLGFYEFIDLVPGTYGVREVQPAGWFDGKDTAGSHGGIGRRTTASPAPCSTTATMASTTTSASCCRARSAAACRRTHGADCDFDDPEILLSRRPDRFARRRRATCSTPRSPTRTGEYEFTGLAPGEYQRARASADRLLRRRRARRHGRRHEQRRRQHLQHHHRHRDRVRRSTRSTTTSASTSA